MDFDEAVRLIRQKDPRYQPQAYDVVRLGLDHARKDRPWRTRRRGRAS
jgi:hypothetical protein